MRNTLVNIERLPKATLRHKRRWRRWLSAFWTEYAGTLVIRFKQWRKLREYESTRLPQSVWYYCPECKGELRLNDIVYRNEDAQVLCMQCPCGEYTVWDYSAPAPLLMGHACKYEDALKKQHGGDLV